MVLDYIADGTGLFIVGAAALESQVFRYGNLYMVNVATVPDGFKNAICQAKNKDVLDGFFAEIVVDAVDLFLAKDLGDLAVQLVRRCEVVPKGFFDDDTCPALAVFIQARGSNPLDDFGVLAGWC